MSATNTSDGSVRVIACDESGSEGENLMASRDPVYVHASTDLALDEADLVMAFLRNATKSTAAELKSPIVLRPKHRGALLDALRPLALRGNIHLVDKTYYVTAKLVDVLVASAAEHSGRDLRFSGDGRRLASVLLDEAPADVGSTFWRMLLRRYNEFIRVYARPDQTPPNTEAFFLALETAISRSGNPRVAAVLRQLWHARFFALEYEGARAGTMREVDPTFTTLSAVARAWRIRLGNVPIELLTDTYGTLTEDVCDTILLSTQQPLTVAGRTLPAVDLRAIRQAPSHTDARIQVADILAGVGREAAALTMGGVYDDDLQVAVAEMLDLQGMWSPESPLDVLYERRPPRYAHDIEGR